MPPPNESTKAKRGGAQAGTLDRNGKTKRRVPRKVTFSVVLARETYLAVHNLAERDHSSKASVVARAIDHYLATRP